MENYDLLNQNEWEYEADTNGAWDDDEYFDEYYPQGSDESGDNFDVEEYGDCGANYLEAHKQMSTFANASRFFSGCCCTCRLFDFHRVQGTWTSREVEGRKRAARTAPGKLPEGRGKGMSHSAGSRTAATARSATSTASFATSPSIQCLRCVRYGHIARYCTARTSSTRARTDGTGDLTMVVSDANVFNCDLGIDDDGIFDEGANTGLAGGNMLDRYTSPLNGLFNWPNPVVHYQCENLSGFGSGMVSVVNTCGLVPVGLRDFWSHTVFDFPSCDGIAVVYRRFG